MASPIVFVMADAFAELKYGAARPPALQKSSGSVATDDDDDEDEESDGEYDDVDPVASMLNS